METIRNENRNFSNTVLAGLKSLSNSGKEFYVLEFKNSTQQHRAGQTKEIIVDYAEIGRSPKCQIRFGEDCRTVSGVHCAILKEGKDYFVKHLSKTNPTLVNGKPVADKWYLSNGDEITLAYGGPVLGFMIPANNKTGSIPLGRRTLMFLDQGLKPYKRAIAGLAAALIICIAGFSWYSIKEKAENKKNLAEIKETNIQLKKTLDSLEKLSIQGGRKNKGLEEEIERIKKRIKQGTGNSASFYSNQAKGIQSLFPSVYWIVCTKVTVEVNGEKKEREGGWTGTGFLSNDGRLITARHVLQPWLFLGSAEDGPEVFENKAYTNGGKVVAYFNAFCSSGQSFEFSSDDFEINTTADKIENRTVNGEEVKVTIASFQHDWAVGNAKRKGNLVLNATVANSLQVGTSLFTLGFPFSLGVSRNGVEPMYADFTVSSSGTSSGFINISSKSFDQGNSGGPVFANTNNGYVVVGIVSAGLGSQGIIIPISKIQ